MNLVEFGHSFERTNLRMQFKKFKFCNKYYAEVHVNFHKVEKMASTSGGIVTHAFSACAKSKSVSITEKLLKTMKRTK